MWHNYNLNSKSSNFFDLFAKLKLGNVLTWLVGSNQLKNFNWDIWLVGKKKIGN